MITGATCCLRCHENVVNLGNDAWYKRFSPIAARSRVARRRGPAYVCAGERRLPTRRQTAPDHQRGNASGSHPPRVLASPDPHGQSNGRQYHCGLCLLELPRNGRGALRFHHSEPRYRRLPDDCPRGGPVGSAATWPLCLRGVGFRRPACIPAARARLEGAMPGPQVHGGDGAIYPRAGPGDTALAGNRGRTHPNAPGRERIRQFRQRPELPAEAAPNLAGCRHPRTVLHR